MLIKKAQTWREEGSACTCMLAKLQQCLLDLSYLRCGLGQMPCSQQVCGKQCMQGST